MLYHASSVSGLGELEPRISTHDKPYVYAICNKVTAACFGAPKDDFDLLMDEVDGVPHLYECYQDALKTIYAGKSCSIYTVHEEGFLSGVTGWDVESVCEHTVPVVQEEQIEDLYQYLQNAASRGACVVHSYSEDASYQSMLREEICERIRDFGLSEEAVKKDKRIARFCKKHNKLRGLKE